MPEMGIKKVGPLSLRGKSSVCLICVGEKKPNASKHYSEGPTKSLFSSHKKAPGKNC